jgi:AcrR family transcriptional regulator
MANQTRRDRERWDREQLIVSAARNLAEEEGWDAVTTRRLAERVEYSQPVLYSHFSGKNAIMAAVAVDGFGDLANHLHTARLRASSDRHALDRVAAAYTKFGDRHPALYDVMFTLAVDLPFATPEAPVNLQNAFNELRETLRPFAGDNLDVVTETFWSGLHGLVTLMRQGRLRREDHERRLTLLIDRFAG